MCIRDSSTPAAGWYGGIAKSHSKKGTTVPFDRPSTFVGGTSGCKPPVASDGSVFVPLFYGRPFRFYGWGAMCRPALRCVRSHSPRSGFDRPSLLPLIGNSSSTMGMRNRESALYGKPTHWLLPTNSRCRLRHCEKRRMASELLFRTMEQNKIETDKKTLTIFTPTYNRAYTCLLYTSRCV